MEFEYLLILGLLYLFALLLKFKFKIEVFNNKKEALFFYAIVFMVGTVWDNYAVLKGHWAYPGEGILGIYIGLVPIEDYFFALVCAYFLLVLYKVIQKKKF